MTLIIRQVTKIKFYYIWLISFLLGMVLTSCNNYIKTEETKAFEAYNDTAFLSKALKFNNQESEAVEIARSKASDQKIRIYAEKFVVFHKEAQHQLDSLSKLKNIKLVNKPENSSALSKVKTSNFDKTFLTNMESFLVNHIEVLENISKSSEDNEIATLAITLLPEYHNQLDTLLAVSKKITKP